MNLKYPLPKDTQKNFERIKFYCSNLSLLLDKYIGYEGKDNWELQAKQKNEIFAKIANNSSFDKNFIQAYHMRWQRMAQSFPYTLKFQASPEWRMIVGLGQSSILETSMTLNRISGIPVIPGSALKGLAASYAMLCVLEKAERLEAEQDENFKAIFGTQNSAGKIIFFDAVPIEAPKLEPDIMNNHHQEYYNGQTAYPAPYQNPVPIYFLTLGKSTKFDFAIAGQDNTPETKKLVSQADTWLKAGLSEFGVGAKTSAGYGYMTLL